MGWTSVNGGQKKPMIIDLDIKISSFNFTIIILQWKFTLFWVWPNKVSTDYICEVVMKNDMKVENPVQACNWKI